MELNARALYEEALAHYKAERYEESLSMVRELRAAVERWPRVLLLEAYLYRDTKRYLAEIRVLWECLAQLDLRQADERKQAATAWSLLGDAWRILGDSRRAVEAFLRSADLEPDMEKSRTECCMRCSPQAAYGTWRRRNSAISTMSIRGNFGRSFPIRSGAIIMSGCGSGIFRRISASIQWQACFIRSCNIMTGRVFGYIATPPLRMRTM